MAETCATLTCFDPYAGLPRGATTTANRYPMRISTHPWHDADDVDRVLAAIRRIAVSQAG